MSRGDSSRTRLTSTASITASKIFSRGECWKPTVISTTSPLRYLLLLSPSRIVAVLRPRLSWSTKTGEEKVRTDTAGGGQPPGRGAGKGGSPHPPPPPRAGRPGGGP